MTRKVKKLSQQNPSNAGYEREFCNKLEDQPVDYNTEVEYLKKVEEDHVRIDTKHNIDVLKADVAKQLCKMKLLGIT